MSINVYWSCIEKEWLRAKKPTPILSKIDKNLINTGITKCPAFRNNLDNTFGLHSLYDYTFELEEGKIKSNSFDQEFFDDHLLIRSIPEKVFSFQQYYIFFTDQDSLKITGNLFPFLEDNNITDRCKVFSGEFDIGKWFRNLEFAFQLKRNYDSFKIEENEIYSYIKFHTQEKINFIQYRHSPMLKEFLSDVTNTKFYSNKFKDLQDYYRMFKTKKLILKEIQKNVL